MAPLETIGILGAGAWGTALARTAARAGRRVVLFARDPEVVRSIRCERRNPRHLPDVALEPAIGATGDLGEVAAADALLLTVPAQCVRALAGQLPPGATPIVIAAKGFETATGLRLSQVVSETAPGRPRVPPGHRGPRPESPASSVPDESPAMARPALRRSWR